MKNSVVNRTKIQYAGRLIAVLGVLVGAAVGGFAFQIPSALAGNNHDIVFQPESKLWLEGDSTLHPYSSKTKKIKIDVAFTPGSTDKTGAEAVKEFIKAGKMVDLAVVIPVESLKSGESLLDTNMYKALNSDQHPNIKFRLTSYKVTGPDTDLDIAAAGKLAINGKEKEVELQAAGSVKGDTIRVKGKETFNMSEFGVKPPELMFGTIKVKDKITIHYDLVGDLN